MPMALQMQRRNDKVKISKANGVQQHDHKGDRSRPYTTCQHFHSQKLGFEHEKGQLKECMTVAVVERQTNIGERSFNPV
jgi:hypothetical protein